MHPKNKKEDLCIPGEYKNQKYFITINDQKFEMDFDDPIFSLKQAVPPKDQQSDLCRLTKQPAEKFCDFCGHKASEDCLYKKRKFQVNKNEVTNEISIAAGEICKICDRKFIMKTVFKKFSEMHDKIDDKINQDCAKFTDIQSKGIAAEKKIKLIKSNTDKLTQNHIKDVELPPLSDEDLKI